MEIADNRDGTLSVIVTIVDTAAPPAYRRQGCRGPWTWRRCPASSASTTGKRAARWRRRRPERLGARSQRRADRARPVLDRHPIGPAIPHRWPVCASPSASGLHQGGRCGRGRPLREYAGPQQPDDLRRVGAGEFVGLMRCRETVMPRVMALMIAARRSAWSAGMAWAICDWYGLGDAGAGGAGGLGVGQHRAQQGQRRDRLARQPAGEPGEDLLGRLPASR